MALRPRREVRKVVVDRDSDYEESSEEEEEEEHDIDHSEDEIEEEVEVEPIEQKEEPKGKKRPITISLKGAKVCKVCKKSGHQAGFVGSVYMDCPNKPCYLCKKPGHTTATCPHRVASEHGVAPAPRRHSLGLVDFVHERQVRSHIPALKRPPTIPDRVDAAILKLHSRRVTNLEFHPTRDNILISGDKKGQLGVWDFEKVFEKVVYETVHSCLVNSIKFSPQTNDTIYTSASDGTVCYTDLETGVGTSVINLNPDGWNGPSTWKMMYAMDVNNARNLVLAADNRGYLYQFDMREPRENSRLGKSTVGQPKLIHKKGTKIVGIHCNPVDPDIFITAGNDHLARMWDLRMLEDGSSSLGDLQHPRVVNSAYFSGFTGNKILTTCQDNRIRVWDSIFGDLSEPSREIVHSHDFNRYLTCFRAEWDPKDRLENLCVIGRYISDDFDGVALHPIDFIDASTGQLVAEVKDKNITTICPVNKLHPRLDVMATGSSRSLFIWRTKDAEELEENGMEDTKSKVSIYDAGYQSTKKGKGKGKYDDDEDDDDDDFCQKGGKRKGSKANPPKIVECPVLTKKTRGGK